MLQENVIEKLGSNLFFPFFLSLLNCKIALGIPIFSLVGFERKEEKLSFLKKGRVKRQLSH